MFTINSCNLISHRGYHSAWISWKYPIFQNSVWWICIDVVNYWFLVSYLDIMNLWIFRWGSKNTSTFGESSNWIWYFDIGVKQFISLKFIWNLSIENLNSSTCRVAWLKYLIYSVVIMKNVLTLFLLSFSLTDQI